MEKFAEDVFDAMMGFLIPAARVPGVENIFEQGSPAYLKFEEIYLACERICQRSGVEEDPECEIIKNSLLELEKIIGVSMFKKGYEFGQKGIFEYISFGRRDQ